MQSRGVASQLLPFTPVSLLSYLHGEDKDRKKQKEGNSQLFLGSSDVIFLPRF